MKTVVIIQADTNDADYVHNITEDMYPEGLEILKKVAPLLKKDFNNWENSEYGDTPPEEMYKDVLTKEEIEHFDELLPTGEDGIHTINSIKIYHVAEEEELFKGK